MDGFSLREAFAHGLSLQADNALGQKNEPYLCCSATQSGRTFTIPAKKEKDLTRWFGLGLYWLQRMATFSQRKMICAEVLVSKLPDTFRLAYEPYPCEQGGWCEETSIPAKERKKHLKRGARSLAAHHSPYSNEG